MCFWWIQKGAYSWLWQDFSNRSIFFYFVAKPPFFLLSVSVSSCCEGQATQWIEWYNFRELLRHSSMLTWHPCARTYKLWSRALVSRKGFWTVKSPFSRPLPWLSRCEEAAIAFYMLMYFLQCIFFLFSHGLTYGALKKKKTPSTHRAS